MPAPGEAKKLQHQNETYTSERIEVKHFIRNESQWQSQLGPE